MFVVKGHFNRHSISAHNTPRVSRVGDIELGACQQRHNCCAPRVVSWLLCEVGLGNLVVIFVVFLLFLLIVTVCFVLFTFLLLIYLVAVFIIAVGILHPLKLFILTVFTVLIPFLRVGFAQSLINLSCRFLWPFLHLLSQGQAVFTFTFRLSLPFSLALAFPLDKIAFCVNHLAPVHIDGAICVLVLLFTSLGRTLQAF